MSWLVARRPVPPGEASHGCAAAVDPLVRLDLDEPCASTCSTWSPPSDALDRLSGCVRRGRFTSAPAGPVPSAHPLLTARRTGSPVRHWLCETLACGAPSACGAAPARLFRSDKQDGWMGKVVMGGDPQSGATPRWCSRPRSRFSRDSGSPTTATATAESSDSPGPSGLGPGPWKEPAESGSDCAAATSRARARPQRASQAVGPHADAGWRQQPEDRRHRCLHLGGPPVWADATWKWCAALPLRDGSEDAVDRRQQPVEQRISTVNRVHQLLQEPLPGGASRRLTAHNARTSLSWMRPRGGCRQGPQGTRARAGRRPASRRAKAQGDRDAHPAGAGRSSQRVAGYLRGWRGHHRVDTRPRWRRAALAEQGALRQLYRQRPGRLHQR